MVRSAHVVQIAATVGGALLTVGSLALGFGADIVRRAAGIPENAEGLGNFVNGTQALVTPMLIMTAAIVPLAFIAGGVALLLGSRRGVTIILAAVGVLLLLGSVTGLVA